GSRRSGGTFLPPGLAAAGGRGQVVGHGFARPCGLPPTPLRGGPFPPRFAPGDKGRDFVPHGVGEGPCRRSLRRREVGGKWWETCSPLPLPPFASLRGTEL